MAVHFTRSNFEGFKTAVYAVHLIGVMMLCHGRTVKMDTMNNNSGECDGDW